MMQVQRRLTWSRRHIAGVLAAAVLALSAAGAISPGSAHAGLGETFCNWYNAAPYGSNGDRCGAGAYGKVISAWGVGYDHSACIDLLNTSNNLVQSWVCSTGARAETSITPNESKGCVRAQVRNNAPGYNRLYGSQGWVFPC